MDQRLTGLTDISTYLWDKAYDGSLDGSGNARSDVRRVLSRAWDHGLEKIFIVGKSYNSSMKALKIARRHKRVYCTVGCHPSKYYHLQRRKKRYADGLAGLIQYSKRKCVAVGNFGLDFTKEGLEACEKKDQLKFFDWHVQFGHFLNKPMLFHYQGDAFENMVPLLTQKRDVGKLTGVCHSFQGSIMEAKELTRKGFYIGFDGCSLKEKKNLEVAKQVPLNRLLLGTSSPDCSVMRPHAGVKYIKNGFFPAKNHRSNDGIVHGRTEPFHLSKILEIVAAVRSMELQELADIIQINVKKLFFAKKPGLLKSDGEMSSS